MIIRLKLSRLAAPLLALGLLAACNDEPASPATDGGAKNAEGDVLKGSISDEMLPLDSLKSQSPSAKIESGPGSDEESSNTNNDPVAGSSSEPAADSNGAAGNDNGADDGAPTEAE